MTNLISSCCNWLFRMSRFLQRGLDFRKRNKQGHTPLHKAAFSGHERFCRWLVETVGLLDSQPDESGNYAADLAEMGELSERYLSVSPACQHCHTVQVATTNDLPSYLKPLSETDHFGITACR